MKIKVKEEGRESIYIPEKESLKSFLKESDYKFFHNYIPGGSIMPGADHSAKSVLEDIDNADRLALLTGDMQLINLGHALSIIKDEKMEMFDIGNISESDLEITN